MICGLIVASILKYNLQILDVPEDDRAGAQQFRVCVQPDVIN